MEQTFVVALGILLGCLFALSWFAGSEALYVPTKITDIKSLLKKAGVKKGKIFYELGSGDGRVVLAAAELGARAYGIEQSWLRVWYSRYKARKLKLDNLQTEDEAKKTASPKKDRNIFKGTSEAGAYFYHGNIFDREYYPADFVYIFLLQPAIDRLEGKLKKELKEGAIIITQTFHFKNWKPIEKIDLTNDQEKRVQLSKGKYAGDFWIYRK